MSPSTTATEHPARTTARASDPAAAVDPDRNGHHDPGTTPNDHQAVLAREIDAYHQHRRQG